MSVPVRLNASNMLSSDYIKRSQISAVCKCLEGSSCSMCTAAGSVAQPGSDLATLMQAAVSKMEKLTKQVSSLSVRLRNLEVANTEGSGSEVEVRASKSRKRSKQSKNRSVKANYKKARVEKINTSSQCEDESISKSELDLKGSGKRCEFKQRASSDAQRSSRRQVEDVSSAVEVSASGSSEDSHSSTDFEEKRKHRRRKVKSGASVKKRPVVKTELWPHTIANEDDGKDTTSEDISLAKFLSCYTYIMINCIKVSEIEGRAVFLHAISTVLECLPWAEARVFHNITMTKIEQNRIKWSSDFIALAGQFLDKKVRLRLSMKCSSGCSSYSNTTNSRSYANNCENANFNADNSFYSNKNNFLYYAICYQWNSGECSFGNGCKRWHVCRSCAEEGKLGEPHKSSSHDSSTVSNRQRNQHF